MLCPYKLFNDDEIQAKMHQKIVETFNRYRNTLIEALECEDYDTSGILDVTQFHEALTSVVEDLDDDMMDYMLFYVYIRS